MPIETLDGGNKLRLIHPKGATLEVLLYGATIISWKSPAGGASELTENLFVSSKAALDGSKPVRGGIPIVYPFFGAPQRKEHLQLAQHGFARNSIWTRRDDSVHENKAGISIKLSLTPPTSLTGDSVELNYIITLTEDQLSTDLHVTNTSTEKLLSFQALLHTYFQAPARSLHIDGLQGLSFVDKTVGGGLASSETRAIADVVNYTDYVYENGPGTYKILWPEGAMQIKTTGFKDVVLWNPGAVKGAEMKDMEEGGWDRYVCVEPGYVVGEKTIAPGETWIGGQVLTPLKNEDDMSV